MNDWQLVQGLWRVIRQSRCSARQFYQGLLLRTLDRMLDVVPLLLAFCWLQAQLLPARAGADWWDVWLSSGFSGKPLQTALVLAGLLAAVFVLQAVVAWLGQRQSFLGSYHIMQSYRQRLLEQIRQLPLGQLARYRAGELADLMTEDLKKLEAVFTHIAADLVSAVLAPLLLLLCFALLDWRYSLALVLLLPVGFLLLWCGRRRFVQVSKQKQQLFRQTAAALSEYVTGIKTFRLFERADYWLARVTPQFQQIKQASLQVEAWGALPVLAYRLMVELGLAVLLLCLAYDYGSSTGAAQPATDLTWLLFALLAMKLLHPLQESAEHLTVLRYIGQSEQHINQLLIAELLPEPATPSLPQHFSLEFCQVSFAYQQHSPAQVNIAGDAAGRRMQGEVAAGEMVLRDLSFVAPAQAITAIVGPSGAGKSTIFNLLARFYDPSAGSVRLGGLDLRDIGSRALTDLVSMVFQKTQLFDGTVLDNIRVGRPDATDEEVIGICKQARCDAFIRQLPAGYHSRIGENGVLFSGGERQRLAIARALLKDAPVLLLDEATASLDPETQAELYQALDLLVQGRTVLVVAHRLRTIMHASQILVLQHGQLVEQGTHQSLLARQGLYQQMWQAQHG